MTNKDEKRLHAIIVSLAKLKEEGMKYILVSGEKNKVNLETRDGVPANFSGITIETSKATVNELNNAVKKIQGI